VCKNGVPRILPPNNRCPTCDAEIEPDEHESIQAAKSAKIRSLNDRLRKSLTGGGIMMAAAVSALPDDVRARARSKVDKKRVSLWCQDTGLPLS
jgi:hypothetical protein